SAAERDDAVFFLIFERFCSTPAKSRPLAGAEESSSLRCRRFVWHWLYYQILEKLNSLLKNLLIFLDSVGAKIIPNATYRWVDVRDVANAHILAFENPTASGRYCLVGRVMHCYEVVKILRELFSDLNLPE
ncbi:phenylacetaldehyde reductase-like isoform X3, partial [Fagus crenata]